MPTLPKVGITLSNGALGGLITTADGNMGLVVTGATEGSVTAGTPFTLTSLQDLIALGVTSATSTNTRLYKEVSEYYGELQGKGTLYVLVVAGTITVDQVALGSNAAGVVKLLDYAKGDVKVVGLMITPQASPTVTAGINALTYTAATNLQATLNTYATAQKPLRGVIAADSFDGVATNLTDMTTSTLNRVAILIGDTKNTNVGGCLGLLLGRLAKVPVQRKISRVKDGALSAATAFIGTVAADSYSLIDAVGLKGFITLHSFVGRNGFFFYTDHTCAPDTDDYSTISRGRVIDKAHRIAYQTYINEVDDEVALETDGTISAGYAKYLEQIITNQINGSMTANREISGFKCSIDLAQNVLSTNQVNVVMKLQPVGYATDIEVALGFAATL